MEGIKFESVIDSKETNTSFELDEFYPQSVVFVFAENIKPIACDIKYLYAETPQKQVYDATGDEEDGIYLTNGLQNISDSNYKFLDTIKRLSFKFGLIHEYYKNKFGVWLDMSSIRPNFATLHAQGNVFQSLISGVGMLDDSHLESSIYTQVCDSKYFSDNSNWDIFKVKNIDDIPQIDRYIVKDIDSNDGTVYRVGRGDGSYTLPQAKHIIFEEASSFVKDNIHENKYYGKFTYELADHINEVTGSGNYAKNDHHKYEDLLLTFTEADGITPYTDLDDMLIFCNGLVVDYQRSMTYPNKIYLNNIIKFAGVQETSTNESCDLDAYTTIDSNKNGHNVINCDVPELQKGNSYLFDITVHKWENTKISHFIKPLSVISTLKVEPTEPENSFWLTTGLRFSDSIDKEKSILLCGNEIVPKSDWEVNDHSKNVVNLLTTSMEFDIIYSEIYRRLKDYLEQIIQHDYEVTPKIEDYLEGNYIDDAKKLDKCYIKVDASNTEFDKSIVYYTKDKNGNYNKISKYVVDFDPTITYYTFHFDEIYDNIDLAIKRYDNDLKEFIENGGERAIHFEDSAMNIVTKQFNNRVYSLIAFDSIDEMNYTIEVIENNKDLDFNRPYRNQLRNKHWEPNDILILNGLNYNLVNEYEDVFTLAPTWYLRDIEGVFDFVDGYKLQVVRHKLADSKYMKLNKAMIIYGPNQDITYYVKDKNGLYKDLHNLDKFDEKYRQLYEDEIKVGMKPHTMYFTYNEDNNEYVLVPNTITEFDPEKTYYICLFNRDYYIKK